MTLRTLLRPLVLMSVSVVGCSAPRPTSPDATDTAASHDSNDQSTRTQDRDINAALFAAKRIPIEEGSRREEDKSPGHSESDALSFLPPLVIDFDSFPSGSILDGVAVAGVTFERVGAPLLVVDAAETRTPSNGWSATILAPEAHRLVASSGHNVLSPGGTELAAGPNADLELDSLTMHFHPPVCQVAFDLASQSADGMSFVTVEVLDAQGNLLHAGQISIKDRTTPDCDRRERFASPGVDTWGFATPECRIAEVRLIDSDNDAACPDSNVGIDSVRFAPAPRWAAADLNDDGIVNELDVARIVPLVQEASQPRAGHGPWVREDLNCDHCVDHLDVALVLAAVGTAADAR